MVLKRFLIIDDEPDIREILTLAVSAEVEGAVCVEAGTVKDALSAFKSGPPFDAIICDYNLPDGKGGEIYRKIRETGSRVPYALCSTEDPRTKPEFSSEPNLPFIEKPDLMAGVRNVISNWRSKTGGESATRLAPYVRIPFNSVHKSSPAGVDLYIKLSGEKYLKIFNADDLVGPADTQKYSDKGIEELWVNRADFEAFVNQYTSNVYTMLKARDISEEGRAGVAVEAHAIVSQALQSIGVTEQVKALTRASVDAAVMSVEKSPKLGDLLKRLKRDPNHYVSSHSVFVSYISCYLASLLEWGTPTALYKLSLAGTVHDITLENEELAKIDTPLEVERRRSEFSSEQVQAFYDHPVKTANLATELMSDVPDVENILIQHHERPDGKGFPQGLGALSVAPLSAVFIMAHDIYHYMEEQKLETLDLPGYLAARKEYFSAGTFKKLVKVLEGLVSQASRA